MTTIMRGGTLLRQYVNSYFETALPPLIDVARTQWGLDQYRLPYPAQYNAIDPTMVDSYPAIGSVVLNDRNHIREDYDLHAQQVYSAVFAVRVMVVVRSPLDAQDRWIQPEKEEALRLRDDMTRLVHDAVLDKPSLGRPNEIKCNESAMLTDYVEMFQANTQSKRWVGASVITLEVAFTESTWVPPIGDADTITVQVENVSPQEAEL